MGKLEKESKKEEKRETEQGPGAEKLEGKKKKKSEILYPSHGKK